LLVLYPDSPPRVEVDVPRCIHLDARLLQEGGLPAMRIGAFDAIDLIVVPIR
jgi:hypothetical protein